jgi:FkbM family methyltransferase
MKDLLASAVAAVPPSAVRRLPAAPRARLQLLMNRALKRRPRRFSPVRTELGFTVAGSTEDIIQRYLYLFGVWEPDITAWVRSHLRPGDVVVDIGANIGYFSLLSATLVGPDGRVVAFEAVPSIADALEANVRRNRLPVEVRREAVGEAPGAIEVFRSVGTNVGRSGTAGGAGAVSEGQVPVVRAADVLPPELWPSIHLVKIDVEGDELRVLRGLAPVLAALPAGAAVLTEITPGDLRDRGGSVDEVLQLFAELGYEGLVVRNSYAPADYARHVPQPPLPLREPPSRQTDVVFVKRSS